MREFRQAMATTRSALTEEDIRTLVKGVSPAERAAAAHKLCQTIDETELSDEDREAAYEILRVMAADAAGMVRRALVVTLKASPLVPRDVALRLARDVEEISLPMLSFSPPWPNMAMSGPWPRPAPTTTPTSRRAPCSR
jgi:uncharacterized protein (DUF2336 family)